MATKSFGMSLKFGNSSGDPVVELRSVGGLSMEIDEIETTSHDQGDLYRRFKPTLVDPGEFEFTAATRKETLAQVLAIVGLEDQDFHITLPLASAVTIDITGFLKSFEPFGEGELDGELICTGSIRISGEPTFGGID